MGLQTDIREDSEDLSPRQQGNANLAFPPAQEQRDVLPPLPVSPSGNSASTSPSGFRSFSKERKRAFGSRDDGTKYVCRFCGSTFERAQALGGHMNGHRKEKKREDLTRASMLVMTHDVRGQSVPMHHSGASISNSVNRPPLFSTENSVPIPPRFVSPQNLASAGNNLADFIPAPNHVALENLATSGNNLAQFIPTPNYVAPKDRGNASNNFPQFIPTPNYVAPQDSANFSNNLPDNTRRECNMAYPSISPTGSSLMLRTAHAGVSQETFSSLPVGHVSNFNYSPSYGSAFANHIIHSTGTASSNPAIRNGISVGNSQNVQGVQSNRNIVGNSQKLQPIQSDGSFWGSSGPSQNLQEVQSSRKFVGNSQEELARQSSDNFVGHSQNMRPMHYDGTFLGDLHNLQSIPSNHNFVGNPQTAQAVQPYGSSMGNSHNLQPIQSEGNLLDNSQNMQTSQYLQALHPNGSFMSNSQNQQAIPSYCHFMGNSLNQQPLQPDGNFVGNSQNLQGRRSTGIFIGTSQDLEAVQSCVLPHSHELLQMPSHNVSSRSNAYANLSLGRICYVDNPQKQQAVQLFEQANRHLRE